METNHTTIDVIIPVYNGERFIQEAIFSADNQTYKPSHIFVIDDGSTDDTKKMVLACKTACPLEYIYQENKGPNAARNNGLLHSRALYVAFLDADDVWEKEKLEEELKLFEKGTLQTLGLVYTNYKNIDANGNDRPDIPTVPLDATLKGFAFKNLLPGNKILGSASSVLIPRSVFNEVGLFDESLRVGEDWDMWLRIAEKFEIDYVNKILVSIRRHDLNQTNNIENLIRGDSAFIATWVPRIKGRYPIPSIWGDRIIFNILRGLPSTHFFKVAKNSLPRNLRKELFQETNGSLILASIVFIIRAFYNKEMRKKMLVSLKRYGKK